MKIMNIFEVGFAVESFNPAGTRRHTDVGSLSLEGRVTDRPNYDVVKTSF